MVAEKARRLLGWVPQFSMEQGLRETIEWYTNRLDVNSASAIDSTPADSTPRADVDRSYLTD
jgi:dTDP-D-glucose 4,6-dehydratase